MSEPRSLTYVVAKMQCTSMETAIYSPTFTQHKVNLGAVCGKDGENASFTKFTPSGQCWMNIADDAPAKEFFKAGKKYYVRFEEAPD